MRDRSGYMLLPPGPGSVTPRRKYVAFQRVKVSSAQALRTLQMVYRLAGLPRVTGAETLLEAPGDDDYPQLYSHPALRRERLRVCEQLHASGLAFQLPGGVGHLPDITEAAPLLLRPLFKLLQPRNHEQLVRHVALNLDWYIDQRRSSVPWFRFQAWLCPAVAWVCFGLCAATSYLMLRSPAALEGYGLLVWPLSLLAVSFLYWIQLRDRNRDGINALELYLYLRESYRDPAEEGEAQAQLEALSVELTAAALDEAGMASLRNFYGNWGGDEYR